MYRGGAIGRFEGSVQRRPQQTQRHRRMNALLKKLQQFKTHFIQLLIIHIIVTTYFILQTD